MTKQLDVDLEAVVPVDFRAHLDVAHLPVVVIGAARAFFIDLRHLLREFVEAVHRLRVVLQERAHAGDFHVCG